MACGGYSAGWRTPVTDAERKRTYRCNICNKPLTPIGQAVVCSCCGMRYFPVEGKGK